MRAMVTTSTSPRGTGWSTISSLRERMMAHCGYGICAPSARVSRSPSSRGIRRPSRPSSGLRRRARPSLSLAQTTRSLSGISRSRWTPRPRLPSRVARTCRTSRRNSISFTRGKRTSKSCTGTSSFQASFPARLKTLSTYSSLQMRVTGRPPISRTRWKRNDPCVVSASRSAPGGAWLVCWAPHRAWVLDSAHNAVQHRAGCLKRTI
mmetsp:Transcript_21336/g.45776  ORF Transcript_21336/g.45776 Transcript_21336/m.45776 type:complete len:207 (+) Transcript_21336:1040-1660(+)